MAFNPNDMSSLEDHLGYWIRLISNHVSHAFSRSLESQGVTVAEWVVLRELWELEQTTPSKLAEHLGMTRGAISKLVERLIGKSLVNRSFDEVDRRCQNIELSDAGRRLVPQLAELADQNDAAFFGYLDESQRKSLMNLLRGVAEQHHFKDRPVD